MIGAQISAARSDEQEEVKSFNHEVEYFVLFINRADLYGPA